MSSLEATRGSDRIIREERTYYEGPSAGNIITAIALGVITNVGVFFIFYNPFFALATALIFDAIIYESLLTSRRQTYYEDVERTLDPHLQAPVVLAAQHPSPTVVLVQQSPPQTSVVFATHPSPPPARRVISMEPPLPDSSPRAGYSFATPTDRDNPLGGYQTRSSTASRAAAAAGPAIVSANRSPMGRTTQAADALSLTRAHGLWGGSARMWGIGTPPVVARRSHVAGSPLVAATNAPPPVNGRSGMRSSG